MTTYRISHYRDDIESVEVDMSYERGWLSEDIEKESMIQNIEAERQIYEQAIERECDPDAPFGFLVLFGFACIGLYNLFYL